MRRRKTNNVKIRSYFRKKASLLHKKAWKFPIKLPRSRKRCLRVSLRLESMQALLKALRVVRNAKSRPSSASTAAKRQISSATWRITCEHTFLASFMSANFVVNALLGLEIATDMSKTSAVDLIQKVSKTLQNASQTLKTRQKYLASKAKDKKGSDWVQSLMDIYSKQELSQTLPVLLCWRSFKIKIEGSLKNRLKFCKKSKKVFKFF